MKIIKFGDRGPLVELLQTALRRAGEQPGETDGIFGRQTKNAVVAFQKRMGLSPDGVVGTNTTRALMPWYTGFLTHTVQPGDSLYKIARKYGSTLRAVELANPELEALNLRIGSTVIVPLPFAVVPTDISFGSTALAYSVRGLAARYPFLTLSEAGKSVMGKSLYTLQFGRGDTPVLYNASHHANEWITTPLLLHFLEKLCAAYAAGDGIGGYSAEALYNKVTLTVVPMVNPDGVDLVVGELTEGSFFDGARAIARNYPAIPFPKGWKANVVGTDLNLQYPAEWEQAREIKFAQGYTTPAPRDFVGSAALSAPESRAMYALTRAISPALTLSYHTQGETIYWKFLDFDPPRSREIGERFAEVSGYALEETPYASGFAGYKDWFIQDFDRPGYTIEAGQGENPLPIAQLPEIFRDNLGILTLGMVLA